MTKEIRESRDKDPKELSIVGNDNWLKDLQGKDTSRDSLKEHVIIPRMKIVSAMSDQFLKDNEFQISDLILDPDRIRLAAKADSTPITILPLFQFMSYYGQAPFADKSKTRKYVSSLERDSEIGRKAQNFVNEPYVANGKNYEYTYRSAFNFVCLRVEDGEILFDSPFILPIKGGEFGTGKNFSSAAAQRKTVVNGERLELPLWAQFWDVLVETHENDDFKWEGFKITPNGSIDLQDSALANKCFETFQSLQKIFDEKRLVMGGSEDGEEEGAREEEVTLSDADSDTI